MNLIDGRKIRDEILNKLKVKIQKSKIKPTLVILLIGENRASRVYVHQKKLAGERIGARVIIDRLSEKVSQEELESKIIKLNDNSKVHGIILQLPVPGNLDSEKLTNMISPEKDVDGFVSGSTFKPATAMGVIKLLKRSKVRIKGRNATVVGRGRIAGKPTAELLREEGAKVEVVHSKTEKPADITKRADILVAAVGKPNLITADMVKKGAVVVDVGTTPVYPRSDDQNPKAKITGDIDFENVSKIASKITPVPGGVGPMTVAALMQNLVKATLDHKE
jgi:methylenetetrahydrofolate dehydrogenase (NADP+)/methenyltetrahydrofolate cyclohydrolase